jgi:hypothetical protein
VNWLRRLRARWREAVRRQAILELQAEARLGRSSERALARMGLGVEPPRRAPNAREMVKAAAAEAAMKPLLALAALVWICFCTCVGTYVAIDTGLQVVVRHYAEADHG